MTRFARASGSKASNQKVPEESTPWSQMRQQAAQGKTDLKQNQGNWKTIINTEKKIEENKKSVWCSFESEKKTKGKQISKNNLNIELKPRNFHKKRKAAKENASCSNSLNTEEQNKSELSSKGENVSLTDFNSVCKVKNSNLKHIKAKLKLSKGKSSFVVEEFPQSKTELCSEKKADIPNSLNFNRRKSKSSCKIKGFADLPINDDNENVVNEISLIPLEKKNSFQKAKRKNEVLDSPNLNKFKLCDNPMLDLEKVYESNEIEVPEKNQWIDGSSVNECFNQKDDDNPTKARGCLKRNITLAWKNRNKQERHSQPYKRRKVDEGDVKLEINGQEIWVTRLDGFYIKIEDAERIRQLEKDLLKRGVSKQEVRAVIKKERRNAEKALARQKKKVCFHCRKGGHTLSSCPKLEDNGAQVIGSGICYKCGSTEHTHYQCKVNSGPSYKFATCFICKQEGHISKQCPDNPRGIYPSGGGCRLCGDVTHFRRECPTLQAKANKLTVGLIGQNVETLGDQSEEPISEEPPKKRQKIIKFS